MKPNKEKLFLMKIVIGTAQFGLKYGYKNKISATEIKNILKILKNRKINFLIPQLHMETHKRS